MAIKEHECAVRFKIAALAPDEKFMRGVVLHVFHRQGQRRDAGNTITE
jgi:hypothetical protein